MVNILHLGNVDHNVRIGNAYDPNMDKTLQYARRFSGFNFISIDIEPNPYTQGRYHHVQEDFLSGLESIADDSIHLVSSDMSLGYYDMRGDSQSLQKIEYTSKILSKLKQKLVPDARVMFTGDVFVLKILLDALEENGYKNIEHRELRPNEFRRTYWTEMMASVSGWTIYQVKASLN